jgi:hypothetical protein
MSKEKKTSVKPTFESRLIHHAIRDAVVKALKSKPVKVNAEDGTVYECFEMDGEVWTEDVPLKGFEVWGGYYAMTTHTTLRGAEEEKAYRESIDKKFPFIMPRSQRELDNAKRLGL